MKSNIFKGSLILLIGFGIFNLLNLVYQFSMARLLTLSELSILATLFSLVYIFAIFSESIQTVVAKYTVLAGSNDGKLKGLLQRFFRKSKKFAKTAILFYLIIAILFYWFLEINYLLLALTGVILYFMFLLPITRGAIQGRKQFVSLSANLVLESGLKLFFSILLVLIGFEIYGAMIGFILGASIAFLFSFKPLKKIYKSNEEPMDVGGIFNYAMKNSSIIAGVILFYSIDVVFARWLFLPEIAGTYAVASLLGKIILWASIPVSKAMFPLAAETVKGDREGKKILRNSIIILLFLIFLCVGMTIFSEEVITLFYGSELTGAVEVLPYLVVAFSLIALSNMILLYKISKETLNRKYSISISLLVLIEAVLFYYNRSNTLSFAKSFLLVSGILMAIAIFSLRSTKNRHI